MSTAQRASNASVNTSGTNIETGVHTPDLAEVDFAKGLQTQIEYVQTRQTERVNADEWVAANAQQTADADGAAACT